MKKYIALFSLFAFASIANAGEVSTKVAFTNISAASAAVTTGTVYNTSGAKLKTLSVTGTSLGAGGLGAFKNMSGTIIAQCAPTASGPWSTCVANDYAQTAVSRTTNGQFTWTDISNYVRLKWTAGTVETAIKAWLTFIKD